VTMNKNTLSKSLKNELRKHLLEELSDRKHKQETLAAVKTFVEMLKDYALQWRENNFTLSKDANKINKPEAVVACAFGYRRELNGNIDPGLMNKDLAKIAINYYKHWGCPVFAQWEIAESIVSKSYDIPNDKLYFIYPSINEEDATIKYLSTKDIFFNVKNKNVYQKNASGNFVQQPEYKIPTKVIIVAHRDHALRCLRIARDLEFEAQALFNDLPVWYDGDSAQPWTTSRQNYIIHDFGSRFSAYRRDKGFYSPVTK
jgi:hypothetical protein